jgi:hypothetical protein
MSRRSLLGPIPSRRSLAGTDDECRAAERLLGQEHPLVKLLRARRTATEQLLVANVAAAAGVGLLLGGLPVGLAVIIGAIPLQLYFGIRLLVLRERRRETCDELIVAGSAPQSLATMEQEGKRLANARHRRQLAGSIEQIAAITRGTYRLPPSAAPHFNVHLTANVLPELDQIAALLRSETADIGGVVLVERLLSSAGSPLYGTSEPALREELARVRYRLQASDHGPAD